MFKSRGSKHKMVCKRRLISTNPVYKQAMERDGHRCTACGSIKRLVIHHIDGRGRGCKDPNHALDNLDTLCNSCHNKWHGTKGNYLKEVSELLGTMSLRAIGRKLGILHTKVRRIRDELDEMEGL